MKAQIEQIIKQIKETKVTNINDLKLFEYAINALKNTKAYEKEHKWNYTLKIAYEDKNSIKTVTTSWDTRKIMYKFIQSEEENNKISSILIYKNNQ